VSEASSKGLLPQLTDVLHALTGSHALLLSTLQSVRLEHMCLVAPVVGLIGEPSDRAPGDDVIVGWPSRFETTTSHTSEAAEAIDEAEPGASWSQIAAVDSDTGTEPVVAATDVADVVATLLSPASAEMVCHIGDSGAVVSRQPPSPREKREPEGVSAGGADSEDRNYNFFDELDARLAGLGDAGPAGNC